MLDRETWEFVNSFAPWLAAMGTTAAVVTSLYLARRAEQIRLEIQAGERIVVQEGDNPENRPSLFWVNATNLGRRQATITTLYWKPCRLVSPSLIWIPPRNRYSFQLPATIEDGASASWATPIQDLEANLAEDARRIFSGVLGDFWLWWTRFCVVTSTGQEFGSRLEKPLRARLRRWARSKSQRGRS